MLIINILPNIKPSYPHFPRIFLFWNNMLLIRHQLSYQTSMKCRMVYCITLTSRSSLILKPDLPIMHPAWLWCTKRRRSTSSPPPPREPDLPDAYNMMKNNKIKGPWWKCWTKSQSSTKHNILAHHSKISIYYFVAARGRECQEERHTCIFSKAA